VSNNGKLRKKSALNKVSIVTDSSALFIDPTIVKRYDVTVVPVRLQLGDTTYRLGIDIGAEEFIRRIHREEAIPHLLPPTPEDFLEVYKRLNRDVSHIISLHLSAHLGQVVTNAKAASQLLLGRCDIEVVDSQTISAGLGMLVDKAGQLTAETDDLEEIVRAVRRAIPRIYSVFYVEKMNVIREQGLIGPAQTILGTMLGIMPFLTIEEGQIMIMEKARTHAQAIEKLAEFAMEFTSIEQMALLTHSTMLTEPVRLLQDRLALELPGQDFPTMLYDPSIGSFLGSDATGLVILEGEEEDIIA
jgi:DegV family protein with EDD domain